MRTRQAGGKPCAVNTGARQALRAILLGITMLPLTAAEADNVNSRRKDKCMAIEQVEIVALVKAYKIDAMHDTFENGGFASYDATEMTVVSPKEYEGPLVIYHDAPSPEGSPWRAESKSIRLRIAKDILRSESTQIFSGAASKVQLIEDNKAPESDKNDSSHKKKADPPKAVGANDADGSVPCRVRRSLPKARTVPRRQIPRAAGSREQLPRAKGE